MHNRVFALPFLLLTTAVAACTAQTDAVSQHINACLLVTEAEVALAIGTPVSAPEKRSDTQCLYHAKRNADETVVVDLDQAPDKDKQSHFNADRKKNQRTSVSDIGDAAFFSPSPPGGVHLTFLKDEVLVTLTITSRQQAPPVEAVTSLGKAASRRLAAHLQPAAPSSAGLGAMVSSSTWTGDWYGCRPLGPLNAKGHLVLTQSGNWSLTTAVVTPGTLLADKGYWQVESFQDILHGTYQFNGKDGFSTTGILNVNWDRVTKNQDPSRFDRILYRSLTGVPHKVTVKRLPPVEPAMLGSWEGSAKYIDHQEEFVWSITSNNLSEFYKAVIWNGEMERDGDRFRLVTTPAKTAPFQIRMLNGDQLELTGGEDPPSQWTRKESILARC
ncbi:MAG: hypothetical protein NW701_20270 [Nitrospira sp.]